MGDEESEIRMGEKRNTFLSFGDRSFDPDRWRKHFANYRPEEWEREGDGILQYYPDNQTEYALAISHWSGIGFVLEFMCRDLVANRRLRDMYAVADMEKLDRFEDCDDLRFPSGCFLTASNAWKVVEDFLNDPGRPSGRSQWIAADEIDWPVE